MTMEGMGYVISNMKMMHEEPEQSESRMQRPGQCGVAKSAAGACKWVRCQHYQIREERWCAVFSMRLLHYFLAQVTIESSPRNTVPP